MSATSALPYELRGTFVKCYILLQHAVTPHGQSFTPAGIQGLYDSLGDALDACDSLSTRIHADMMGSDRAARVVPMEASPPGKVGWGWVVNGPKIEQPIWIWIIERQRKVRTVI